MSLAAATAAFADLPNAALDSGIDTEDRRLECRNFLDCDLWMIDHHGGTVLRCRCIDVSCNGMRLRVPLGYGVAEGQRYELRSHLPGSRSAAMLGIVGSRWATVVRTQLVVGQGEDHLDVGLVLDTADTSTLRVVGSF
jgi:hypothetical protein